jgi:hypothetical protein
MTNDVSDLEKYEQRERFWSEQSQQQLGYSINFFLTIGLGFLVFLIGKRGNYPSLHFDFRDEILWALLLYYLIGSALFFSILSGCISILSRLYDLRVTRHVVGVRRKVYKILKRTLPNSEIDLTSAKPFRTFVDVVLYDFEFIQSINEDNFQDISLKYMVLRKQGKLLGRLTWRCHKVQILFLLIATILYTIELF